MQFMAGPGRGFPPHHPMGMAFPPQPWGPGPCFPPNPMGGDFPPPPHMFPPNFDQCGPPPPQGDFGGPFAPFPGNEYPDGRLSNSPNHCFPSPPTQSSDFSAPVPPPGEFPSQTEPCFPSPPLDFSCAPDYCGTPPEVSVKSELPMK